jgi:hypothetical protein
MTFESMSNIEAQNEYEAAIRKLSTCKHHTSGPEWDKAISALMRLYPQWKQFEWEQCLNEDVKEAKEREDESR